MKKYLLVFFTAILMSSCLSGKMESVSLEPVTSTFDLKHSQDELYVKSNSWMVKAFASSKSVIQFSDKESGTIIGKYLIEPKNTTTGMYNTVTTIQDEISAIITIQVKDNRTKISIAPNDYTFMSGANAYGITTKEEVEKRINDLVSNYEYSMQNDDSMEW